MVHLAREYSFVFFRPPALGNILEAVHGADNVSGAILDCLDVNERDAAQTVGPLNVDFCSRTETPVRSTSAMGH